MAVIEMSVSDWDDVPDNPRQRDTETRAENANRKHLSSYFKTHDYVFAATMSGEIRWKLDGHTRSYLWKAGRLDPPPSGKVQVMLIEVSDKQEAMDIYDALDSGRAVKSMSDRVFGSTREHKFRLKSPLLRRCKFGTQLQLADTGKCNGDPPSLTKNWKNELLAIDSLDLPKKHPTLISSMLLSVRRDGLAHAGEFWKAVYQDRGTKDQRGSDGIEALCRHMDVRVAQGRTAGYENVEDILAVAWYAYEVWNDGKRVKRLGRAKIGDLISSFKKKASKNVRH